MKPEQQFWNLIKKHVPGHAERMENVANTGTPDVNFCSNGRQVWLELKVSLTTDIVKVLRPAQLIWHAKRVENKGLVYVLQRYEDKIILHVCFGYKKYAAMKAFNKPWNWSQFTDALEGEYG